MDFYEVLAPVGRFSDLQAIVAAGADAVYVGLNGYSSRPSVFDFTLHEITLAREQISQNIIVAINGNLGEDRMNTLKSVIRELDAIGVDAIVAADWGLMQYASQVLRHTKLHASTLLGVYNFESAKLLVRMGVDRLVFSTNLRVDEMHDIICSVPELTYEVIAKGGICFNDNRCCRLPHTNINNRYKVFCDEKYNLYQDNEYCGEASSIHAPSIDLCSTIESYMALGIKSFKIEGRTLPVEQICRATATLRVAVDNATVATPANCLHYLTAQTMQPEARCE